MHDLFLAALIGASVVAIFFLIRENFTSKKIKKLRLRNSNLIDELEFYRRIIANIKKRNERNKKTENKDP